MPPNVYRVLGKERTYWRKTFCRVRQHTWVLPTGSYLGLNPTFCCDCGMLTLAEGEQLEQESKVNKER